MKRLGIFLMLLIVLGFAASTAAQTKKGEKKVELPPAVAKAVKDNFRDAEIDKMEVEEKDGISLYDIEFKAGAGEIEVAEDGTVIDIATIIKLEEVPKPAAEIIQKAAESAKARIKQLEKSEVRAEVQEEGGKAKVVKLAAPRYVYEAELVRGAQTGEIEVAPDGQIIEPLKWEGEQKKKVQ